MSAKSAMSSSKIVDVNSFASSNDSSAHSKLEPTIPVDSSSFTHSPFRETGTEDLSNFPSCGGVCLYGNVKLVNESEFQAMIGVIWQFTSPEQTNAKTKRLAADAQTVKSADEQNTIWMDKLVTAFRTGDISGVRGFAILLAPKLGKTPENLIDEIGTCGKINGW
jgi:hypothetical protein